MTFTFLNVAGDDVKLKKPDPSIYITAAKVGKTAIEDRKENIFNFSYGPLKFSDVME